MNLIYFSKSIVICAGLTSFSMSALAQGLDSLKPKGSEANQDVSKEDKALIKDMKRVKADAKGNNSALSDKLSIATSFGWIGATKDSNSWNASAMGDVTVKYKLPLSFSKFSTAASFRYAPMDVAPEIKGDDDVKRQYKGVIEGYHGGFHGEMSLMPKLSVHAGAELGMMIVYLNDVTNTDNDRAPEDGGVNITFSGGADWELLPKFVVGPKLYLGAGTFTTFQLSANATFVF